MTISIFEIYKIFRQVAIDSGVINSFAVIDNRKDLNSNSLNKNAKDSDLGTFWSRHGVTPDNNMISWPALTLEWKTSDLSNLKNTECHDLAISVHSQYDCPTCKKTWPEIDIDNFILLKSVLKRASEYEVYEIGGDLYWIHPSAAPEGAKRKGCIFETVLRTEGLEIFSSLFGVDNLRSKSTETQICFCSELIDFTPTDWIDKGGAVKCQSC